ncbi:Uncharacterised protein [Mycobacterium tuberculosis]|uniref:Uncharacterized protein n=1 Tax=Mycobacterium tuberculosis TaxID=1773 RepID=A0A916P8J3_MYCTX|nr:Uncharacterised protein [Mycobacterium tuberculosis]COY84405.1 Uncharacterised protein [Mycobacterium tuberculosis]
MQAAQGSVEALGAVDGRRIIVIQVIGTVEIRQQPTQGRVTRTLRMPGLDAGDLLEFV